MTDFTARDVREWAAANGHTCSPTGRVPNHLVEEYLLDVHGVTTDPGDVVVEPVEEEPTWSVTVTIPGDVDPDVIDTISGHVLEAVYAAYYAGRDAERSRILAELGGGK